MSTTITAADVKALRQRTGAGMMDCKKTLQEADGDIEKAVELLRVKLGNKVGKLADRETTEGTVQAFIAADGKRGVLVEVDCNTDFVARNDDFIAFAKKIAEHVAGASDATGPVDVAALLTEEIASGQTIEAARADVSATTGENVVISRADRFVVSGEGALSSYIHATGKVGVVVEVGGVSGDEAAALAKEVALHVAATPPRSTSPPTTSRRTRRTPSCASTPSRPRPRASPSRSATRSPRASSTSGSRRSPSCRRSTSTRTSTTARRSTSSGGRCPTTPPSLASPASRSGRRTSDPGAPSIP